MPTMQWIFFFFLRGDLTFSSHCEENRPANEIRALGHMLRAAAVSYSRLDSLAFNIVWQTP